MKKLLIYTIMLLFLSNQLFTQKKTTTKTQKPTKSATTPAIQSDFQNRVYGSIGLSVVNDYNLENATNFGIGYEHKMSDYFSIGGNINLSSYPCNVDRLRKSVFQALFDQHISTWNIGLTIDDFYISLFNLEGYMKIKFSDSRDGFYGKLGATIIFMSRDEYKYYLGEGSEMITETMDGKKETLIGTNFALGYDLEFSRNVGMFCEFKYSPSLRASGINNDKIVQLSGLLSVYYKF
jgi:hypothetical protein